MSKVIISQSEEFLQFISSYHIFTGPITLTDQ